MTIEACGDEHNAALWFTPDAIRDHFEADEDEVAAKVAAMTDEQLAEIGLGCLSDDVIYSAFHEALVQAVEDA